MQTIWFLIDGHLLSLGGKGLLQPILKLGHFRDLVERESVVYYQIVFARIVLNLLGYRHFPSLYAFMQISMLLHYLLRVFGHVLI
jgi:hypothetical protein